MLDIDQATKRKKKQQQHCRRMLIKQNGIKNNMRLNDVHI